MGKSRYLFHPDTRAHYGVWLKVSLKMACTFGTKEIKGLRSPYMRPYWGVDYNHLRKAIIAYLWVVQTNRKRKGQKHWC